MALLHRMENGSLVFLDGRNEHGSHVLHSFPTSIPLSDDDLAEDAERILTAAEQMGFSVGQHVWATFARIDQGGGWSGWEFIKIDRDITEAIWRSEGWLSAAEIGQHPFADGAERVHAPRPGMPSKDAS